MIDTKHTPGPWILDLEPDDLEPEHAMICMATSIEDRASFLLQHRLDVDDYVDILDGEQLEEAVANLRLMAAAPTILDAAEEAMHALLEADSHVNDRIAAAKKIAEVIGHPWPPYPDATDPEGDDDA